jgi:hypothetical protein
MRRASGSVAAGAGSQLGGVAVCVGIDGVRARVRAGCSPAMGRDGRVLATAGSAPTGMAVRGLWPAAACEHGKQVAGQQAGQGCSAAALYRIEVWAEGEGQRRAGIWCRLRVGAPADSRSRHYAPVFTYIGRS